MSLAQIVANTANAFLSTGPRTTEGKERSAQNARTHGLTSRDLVVDEHEREQFEGLQSALRDELAPTGALELTIYQQLIHAAWNLARIRRMEAELWQNEPNPLLDDTASKAFDRLSKYQVRTERSYYRALKELKVLQAARKTMPPAEPNANSAKQTQSSAPLPVQTLPPEPLIPVAPALAPANNRVLRV